MVDQKMIAYQTIETELNALYNTAVSMHLDEALCETLKNAAIAAKIQARKQPKQ